MFDYVGRACSRGAYRAPELAAVFAHVHARRPGAVRVKEVFETVEAYRQCAGFVLDAGRHGPHGRVARIYDLACGHGLLGLLLAYRFPGARVTCVDLSRRGGFNQWLAGFRAAGHPPPGSAPGARCTMANLAFVEGDLGAVLDGLTGDEHWEYENRVDHTLTPAVGDIDGDGISEIVTATRTQLLALNHDGSQVFSKPLASTVAQKAIALADLDNDGEVEIVVGQWIYNSKGELIQTLGRGNAIAIPVDLDGDGDLEIVEGFSAWHHDGVPVFEDPGGITFMTFSASPVFYSCVLASPVFCSCVLLM